MTGRDFGFDLAAWRQFLLADEKLSEEYTFDDAWKGVRKGIERMLNNPDRLRLVHLMETQRNHVRHE